MNREEITRMAREAGLSRTDAHNGVEVFVGVYSDIERFAALARADEREALTEEEIGIALSGVLGIPHEIKVELAREVERAHGIGENDG